MRIKRKCDPKRKLGRTCEKNEEKKNKKKDERGSGERREEVGKRKIKK